MTDRSGRRRERRIGLYSESWSLGRSRGRFGYVGAFVWLLFIIFPLANAIGRKAPGLERGLTIAGAAAFVAAYIALVTLWRMHKEDSVPPLLFGVLVVVASALTFAGDSGWAFLFTYCSACTALIAPARLATLGVVLCAALAGGGSALAGAHGGSAVGFGASAAGIGLLMLLVRDLRLRNEELSQARAELARLAVAQERERFARDLHDLLGHSLSVIALKAELAGRLLPHQPREAAAEVAEVEQVARNALGEVRHAVSGYRKPTLEGELAGARMALSAAGIEAEVERAKVTLDPEVEAVLAWAVREGATNVIRHSGASRCTLKIHAGLRDAAVEVVDDGNGGVASNGGDASNGARGNGLAGLTERAEQLRGRIEAGSRPEGGFRLAVTLPVSPA